MKRTRHLPATLLGMIALASFAPTAGGEELPSPGSGLRVSLGPTAGRLVLPDRTAAALAAEGVPLDSGGAGMELGLGWAFNPRFEVGLRLAGVGCGDDECVRQPRYGQFTLEATTHLRPGTRFNPHLTGGVGGAAIAFGDDPSDDNMLEAGAVMFGAGVELQWTRHWGMTFEYRYTMLTLERQDVVLPGGGREVNGEPEYATTNPISVEGDAAAHQIGFAWNFRM